MSGSWERAADAPRILELQPLGVRALSERRWGLAPFHYSRGVHREIKQRVLARRRSDPPCPRGAFRRAVIIALLVFGVMTGHEE